MAVFDAALARELRRPIDPAEVRFKVQRETDGLVEVVAYIEVRAVVARLNLLAPGGWSAETSALPVDMRLQMAAPSGEAIPARLADGRLVADTLLRYRCLLTVHGVPHEDVGEGEDPKSAYSDALKRAAVRFGVGECLYAFRPAPLRAEDGPAVARMAEWLGVERAAFVVGRRGRRAHLTHDNREALRAMYARWLERVGEAAFGPALGHAPAPGDGRLRRAA